MKNNLRIFGKKKRSAITLDIESKASLSIQIKYCLDKIFFLNHNIKTASIYYPINNEITPFGFTKYFKERKIVMSMPVVDIKKKSMLFRKWSPKDDLAIGPLGNLEPTHEKEIILPQIMIVPMLMFDREFIRLGYGGGYYDKSIIKLKKYFQKENVFFTTVGLAYSAQEFNKLPHEKHDMNLDYIVTEKECLFNAH
jgi:5-formyltetrahydrofolate cyclo-ligase